MKNNKYLAIALLMGFATLFISCKSTTKNKKETATTEKTTGFIKDVPPAEFKKLIDTDDVILLDVRTPKEVQQGHIKGSSSINFYSKDFVEKINLINKEKAICVYCRSGNRSSKAAKILQKNGFNRIYNLDGGVKAWDSASLPLTASTVAEDKHIKVMQLNEFKELLKTNQPVLVEFHTVWCAPCRKMASVIDEIETEYKNKAVVVRIDVDKSKEIAKTYHIRGVPVFILFKNGVQKWKHNGIIAKEELISQIEKEK